MKEADGLRECPACLDRPSASELVSSALGTCQGQLVHIPRALPSGSAPDPMSVGDRSFPVRPLRSAEGSLMPHCAESASCPELSRVLVGKESSKERGRGGSRAQRARKEGEQQREEKCAMMERQIKNNHPKNL